MTESLRVAVIGAGNIARRYHLPSLARLRAEGPGLELAAVCDVDPARAESAAERFGFARADTDYRAMLSAVRPDAVWVLVPFQVVREVAGHVLARRVPLIMEKPPGQNVAEVRELAAIAQEAGTPHQVALNRRYAPLLRRAKELLAKAGPVAALSCQLLQHNRQEATHAFGTGIHGLDALRFLGPGEVTEVHARPVGANGALVTLIFAGGAVAHMEMLPQVGVQMERYTAHAGTRTVVIDGLYEPLTTYPGYLHCYDAGRLAFSWEDAAAPAPPEVICGFYGESEAFVRALREGRAPTPSLAEALRSVEIAQAVQEGKSVVFG